MTDRIESPEHDTATCDNCECAVDSATLDAVICLNHSASAFQTWEREQWCEDCRDNSAVTVEGSDTMYAQDYAEQRLYCWDDGSWHFDEEEQQEEDEEEDSRLLFDYGTDVLAVHSWPSRTDRKALCMGVELEMESNTRRLFPDMVNLLGSKRGNGRYILKYDGSLADGQGAELVTLPYTLEDHQTYFGWDKILSRTLAGIARSGSGTSNCGIHVHVNREALTPLTIGKLLVFLNLPENDRFVTAVAQRSSNSMCSRDAKKAKVTAPRSVFTSRYDILNVEGYRTIEFRMFKGNLRPERVLKNVEFCHSLISFVEKQSIQTCHDRGAYVAWVERQAKRYPHLVAFLVEKGYVTPPSPLSSALYARLAHAAAYGRTVEA